MSKIPYISGKSIWEMTPQEFQENHEKLYQRPDTKASKGVPDVTLTFPNGKSILRIRRVEKVLHEFELRLLSEEHDKTFEELLELCMKKKVQVINEKNEVLNAPPPKERNAKRSSTPRRKKKSKDQLLESGPPEYLHEEGSV